MSYKTSEWPTAVKTRSGACYVMARHFFDLNDRKCTTLVEALFRMNATDQLLPLRLHPLHAQMHSDKKSNQPKVDDKTGAFGIFTNFTLTQVTEGLFAVLRLSFWSEAFSKNNKHGSDNAASRSLRLQNLITGARTC